jgi:hypothetical protein
MGRGITVFWDMTSCSLVNIYQGFGRKFLARTSGLLLFYAAMERASSWMLRGITLQRAIRWLNHKEPDLHFHRHDSLKYFVGDFLTWIYYVSMSAQFGSIAYRSFATRVSQLKIWHFLIIDVERIVCRCTFNRYSVITQFVKLAAREQLCCRCTHRKV